MSELHEKALENWDITRLIPYKKNAKKHPKEQIQKIMRSIEKHGLINPPNIEPDGTMITGHGRLLALTELGWKEVPVFVRYDLSKQDAAAARLADNKVGEGDYDTNVLQEELRWLSSEDVDLTDIGFDERELNFLIDDLGEMSHDLMLSEPELVEAPAMPEADMPSGELTEPRVPLSQVFACKDVTASQARTLNRFLAMIDGGEVTQLLALVAHAEQVLADA